MQSISMFPNGINYNNIAWYFDWINACWILEAGEKLKIDEEKYSIVGYERELHFYWVKIIW